MKKNMGSTDRIIRVIIAALIGILYYTETITGTVGIILLVLAAIFVLTSIFAFCPTYTLFGFSTTGEKSDDQTHLHTD